MSNTHWALLRPDEDGNPVKWLSGERELRELLADPEAWGIDEFVSIDDMQQKDPAHWQDGQAMLMRVEVVVPVRGGWRLPEDGPQAGGEWVVGRSGPIKMGDVAE
jgi:hypothetical protein